MGRSNASYIFNSEWISSLLNIFIIWILKWGVLDFINIVDRIIIKDIPHYLLLILIQIDMFLSIYIFIIYIIIHMFKPEILNCHRGFGCLCHCFQNPFDENKMLVGMNLHNNNYAVKFLTKNKFVMATLVLK